MESLAEVYYRMLDINFEFLRPNNESLNINMVTFLVVFYAFGVSTYSVLVRYADCSTKCIMHYMWNIFIQAPIIVELQFYSLVYILKQRLVWLNKILRTVVDDNAKSNRSINVLSLSQSSHENNIVRKIGVLHYQLWSISKKINKAYSFQIFLLSLQAFLFILYLIFFILTTIVNKNSGIPLQIYVLYIEFTVYFLLSIVVICVICSSTSNEAEETKILFLQLLQQSNRNSEYDFEILRICLQIMHNKIKFTALGLFTLDKKFIYLFMTAIVTYAVLILQIDVAVHE